MTKRISNYSCRKLLTTLTEYYNAAVNLLAIIIDVRERIKASVISTFLSIAIAPAVMSISRIRNSQTTIAYLFCFSYWRTGFFGGPQVLYAAIIASTPQIINATSSEIEQFQFGPVDRRNLGVLSDLHPWSIFMTASWTLHFLFYNK